MNRTFDDVRVWGSNDLLRVGVSLLRKPQAAHDESSDMLVETTSELDELDKDRLKTARHIIEAAVNFKRLEVEEWRTDLQENVGQLDRKEDRRRFKLQFEEDVRRFDRLNSSGKDARTPGSNVV